MTISVLVDLKHDAKSSVLNPIKHILLSFEVSKTFVVDLLIFRIILWVYHIFFWRKLAIKFTRPYQRHVV